jgi:F0F1-type ATP synthase beta subunit
VKIADTVKGFMEIVEGKHDNVPEQAFYMKAQSPRWWRRQRSLKVGSV